MIFEVELKGFDGNTDATDHLIKWVKARGVQDVEKLCDEQKWDVACIHFTDLPEFAKVDFNVTHFPLDNSA